MARQVTKEEIGRWCGANDAVWIISVSSGSKPIAERVLMPRNWRSIAKQTQQYTLLCTYATAIADFAAFKLAGGHGMVSIQLDYAADLEAAELTAITDRLRDMGYRIEKPIPAQDADANGGVKEEGKNDELDGFI